MKKKKRMGLVYLPCLLDPIYCAIPIFFFPTMDVINQILMTAYLVPRYFVIIKELEDPILLCTIQYIS
jgi:hypothetical protein